MNFIFCIKHYFSQKLNAFVISLSLKRHGIVTFVIDFCIDKFFTKIE